MTEPNCKNDDNTELTKLMRSIAREIAYEAIIEHLEDFEHKPKKPDPVELES